MLKKKKRGRENPSDGNGEAFLLMQITVLILLFKDGMPKMTHRRQRGNTFLGVASYEVHYTLRIRVGRHTKRLTRDLNKNVYEVEAIEEKTKKNSNNRSRLFAPMALRFSCDQSGSYVSVLRSLVGPSVFLSFRFDDWPVS